MASTRKLLSEIDRTLKKTNDGLDYFDQIWDKVYSASSSSQRDKHEADLKKEIKKLQRFRDQIKNWIANPDAKEKHVAMMNVRKEVELKMEQFKICEREVKTKAYSREGLALQRKLDPEEQAKLETRDWVQECITKLEEQVEAVESDLEKIYSAKSKRGKKTEIQTLETLATRHKWHILKLEQVTRLLDNDCLTKDQVDSFKDDIEYYLEANMEPDFMDIYGDDNIYEALDLDALGAEYPIADVSASSQMAHRGDDSDPTSNLTGAATPQFVESSLPIVGRAGAVKPAELRSTKSSSKYSKSNKSSSSNANSEDKSSRRSTPSSSSTTSSSSAIGGEQQPSMAALLRKQQQQQAAAAAVETSSPTTSGSSASKMKKTSPSNYQQTLTSRPSSSTIKSTISTAHASGSSKSSSATTETTSTSAPVSETPETPAPTSVPAPPMSYPAPVSQSLNEEHYIALRLLETSYSRIPTGNDSDRIKQYVPRNPYPTSSVFPSTPSNLFDHSAVFEKFDTDTLFFIFYYQQGTYQQYLAARELKKQTWAYHKKYMTWFKRHEEPKVTTEEYEQGTYVYFDYETGWCQRIKSEFTFEYNFLEDELTV